MGRHFRKADSAGQGYLMPPDARQWLPERHLAWALLKLAAELDLAGFEARYRADGQGRAAYDPAMMVTLVMYCYCKGIRSCRGIEMATFDDVGARVICGNLHPDHATTANFTASCQAELYVALTRESRQTGRSTRGYAPAAMMPSWEQMAARLDTPEGKALYKQRGAIIEPVFAQLFARLGRHLNYRGTKVDLELHLWAISHNLLKAISARQRAGKSGTGTPGRRPGGTPGPAGITGPMSSETLAGQPQGETGLRPGTWPLDRCS